MNGKDFLNDRSDYHIRHLFKSFLGVLEDLKAHHEINFAKLYDSIPEKHHDVLEMSDYMDEEYFQLYRKKVLDLGNSALRDYNSEIENLTVEFRFKQ